MKKNNLRAYLAECIGTFVLVLFGCGVAVISGGNLVATALAFGLVIVAMAYSIGNVSGCHINPAVSFSMALLKKISWKECGFYVIAQTIGGFLGSLTLWLILGNNGNLGANAVNDNVIVATGFSGLLIGLLVEIVLTFVFILTILGVTDKVENKVVVGLVIGFALTLVHLLGINLTGTSVNPARSLAPAILQGGVALSQIWIFIVGPLLGSALAAFTYQKIRLS